MLKFIPIVAISMSAFLAAGAAANAQSGAASGQVLTGDAAFGDWSKDAPGVTRHFTVDDLPKPGATPSASNSAHGVPLPDGLTPKVPDGFKVELVAQGIKNPRAIRFAPNGDLFVANSAANEVRVYRIAEGSAKPTEEGVFATDKLNQPYGIAFYPPGDNPEWVYVANADGLVRFPYKSGDLKAGGAPEVILEGIPPNHHWTRDVVFSPDGKTLYFSVGSGSNVAEDMAPEPEGGVDAWAKDHALGATWGS